MQAIENKRGTEPATLAAMCKLFHSNIFHYLEDWLKEWCSVPFIEVAHKKLVECIQHAEKNIVNGMTKHTSVFRKIPKIAKFN